MKTMGLTSVIAKVFTAKTTKSIAPERLFPSGFVFFIAWPDHNREKLPDANGVLVWSTAGK